MTTAAPWADGMLQPAAPTPQQNTPAHLAVVLCLTLPWVLPLSMAPLANVVPWLISWACLALALLQWRHITATAIAQSWAVAALLSSVIGLVQYFGYAETFAPAVHVPAYLGDAVGNLRQRNQLATLLSIGMLAVYWWLARGLAMGHALWMQAVLAMGLAASASRTGLFQLLFIGLWLLLHRRADRGRQAGVLALVTLAVYGLASLAWPGLLLHLTGQGADNAIVRMAALDGCGSRQVLWTNVMQLIAQQPLTGWGWDNLRYAHYITDYNGPRFCDLLGNAHNLPLHLAFTWGIPAAAFLMAALLIWIWRARPWRPAGSDRQLAWGVIGVIGLHSLLEYPLWYGPFQIAIVLSLWMMGGQLLVALRAPAWPPRIGVCLLAMATFVAYDFAQVRQIYLPASERWAPWRHQPLEIAQRSWLFSGAALFAEVTSTRLSQDNARWLFEASQQTLYISPEPRVIEKLLESAQWLGENDTYERHLQRYQDNYPQASKAWLMRQTPSVQSQ